MERVSSVTRDQPVHERDDRLRCLARDGQTIAFFLKGEVPSSADLLVWAIGNTQAHAVVAAERRPFVRLRHRCGVHRVVGQRTFKGVGWERGYKRCHARSQRAVREGGNKPARGSVVSVDAAGRVSRRLLEASSGS